MPRARERENAKYSLMHGISVRQPFRMKLHTQQERQQMRRIGFQLHAFNDSVIATSDDLQRLGDSPHRLMMGAVDAQTLSAGYVGQYAAFCQSHFMRYFAALVHPPMVRRPPQLAGNVRNQRATQ